MGILKAWLLITLLCGLGNTQTLNNQLSPGEAYQGFSLLFDGTMKSVREHFLPYQKEAEAPSDFPTEIEVDSNGAYFFDNNAHVDIRSKEKYADFELRLDYRISDNGGIYCRANLSTYSMYENAIEYPLYNNKPNPDKRNAPGGAYDMYPPFVENYKRFETGIWNTVRIRYYQDSVYHWHNDALTAKFELQSDDYKYQFYHSHMDMMPCVLVEQSADGSCVQTNPLRKTGYIGFQTGYPGNLYIRNLRIANYPFLHDDTTQMGIQMNKRRFEPMALTQIAHGIDVQVSVGGDFDLDIFSLGGKLVKHFHGGKSSPHFVYQLTTPGIYFVHLLFQGKITIQRAMVF